MGEAEVKNGTVNVRTRENRQEGEKKVDDFVAYLEELRADRKWECAQSIIKEREEEEKMQEGLTRENKMWYGQCEYDWYLM